MITLVFVLSAAALVSSQYHHYRAEYPQHIPVIDHNGVPVDTPEVQAARASHLAALSAAHVQHVNRYTAHPTSVWGYAGVDQTAYRHHAVPLIAPDGTPVDTPEVQIAKSAHFAAYNEAAARNSVSHGPIDTPAVQHAKAEHFAAYAQAAHHNRYRRALLYTYPYAQHFPIIDHDGSPVETPEVQVAKAHHFAAHAEARYRNAAAPLHYASVRYAAHVPIITENGVPVDTPEVQHAKAAHFAAYAEAATRNHYGAHYGAVVPLDTPEVQLAKIQHFAAHQVARSHHH